MSAPEYVHHIDPAILTEDKHLRFSADASELRIPAGTLATELVPLAPLGNGRSRAPVPMDAKRCRVPTGVRLC